jgi:hypothetical protein
MALTKKINGKTVKVTTTEERDIRANWSENSKEQVASKYREKREKAYPSIVDQLDKIFHSGIDGWRADIQKIKDEHPKPEEV